MKSRRGGKDGLEDSPASNVARLESFWNRRPFHDMVIESVSRVNRRVVMVLEEFILVLTGASRYRENVDEFPTVWISESLDVDGREGRLDVDGREGRLRVETEPGELEARFENLRLLRREDFAILVPPVDS